MSFLKVERDNKIEELHDSLDDAVNERANRVKVVKKKDEESVSSEAASLTVSLQRSAKVLVHGLVKFVLALA